MADRYWVGGTANWDGTAGTKWAASSGGPGGETVPTTADDVYFSAASTGTCTIATGNTGAKSINCTGFTGTIAGTGAITIAGSVTLVTGMTWTHTGNKTFSAAATLTTAGKTFGQVTVDAAGATVELAAALTLGSVATSGSLTVTRGTFKTNNYTYSGSRLISDNTNTREIDLGSSTVTLASTSTVQFQTTTGLTFTAGTSQINCSSTVPTLASNNQTFYNVAFTSNSASTVTINGTNTFNNLSFTGSIVAGLKNIALSADQTVTGTLTFSAGTNATMRHFCRSDTIGTTRTITAAAVSMTDVDFRDITIAGAAAPASGTRIGDCKGNSGITFTGATTRYWNLVGSNNWSATGWAANAGATPAVNNFPLAQDTCVFTSTSPGSGSTITINANYNIGTIDMSARTTNTMTLATGSTTPTIYGDWINGTGTTLTGTGLLSFIGRGSQTITSAGAAFTQPFGINTPNGSVTLLDAFTTSSTSSNALAITQGTFNADQYNVTLSGSTSSVNSANSLTRTIAVGSGTWSIAGSGTAWNVASSSLTVTGTGTISLTSASAKTFAGGGVQTYPTLNQGGTGTLTISGSNRFQGLTDTAVGRIQFTGGTTQTFDSFSIGGSAGNLIQLGSSNTNRVTLRKPSPWVMGANSTDGGNNIGLTFVAGDIDYISASYINGVTLLSAGLYTNTQTFYTPTVTQVGGGVTLLPDLYTNTQTFYGPTVSTTVTLAPDLYSNAQTFYAPTVSATVALTPALYTNAQAFYSPTISATYALTPALYANAQTFYAPAVTTTATIAPSLFTNTQTFYAPLVELATQSLLPDLYSNTQIFYGPTITQSKPYVLKYWNGSYWQTLFKNPTVY